MTTFVDDSFTSASTVELSTHSPETGGAWAKLSGSSTDLNCHSSDYAVGTSTTSTGLYVNATTPGSANYYVEAPVSHSGGTVYGSQLFNGVLARAIDTTAYYQAYFVEYNYIRLARAGTTLFDFDVTSDPLISTPKTLRLDVSGTGATVTLQVTWNGVALATKTDVSGSRLVAAGQAGIRARSDGKLYSFTAVDDTSGSSSVPVFSNTYSRFRR